MSYSQQRYRATPEAEGSPVIYMSFTADAHGSMT
jgi:hypothetical protein